MTQSVNFYWLRTITVIELDYVLTNLVNLRVSNIEVRWQIYQGNLPYVGLKSHNSITPFVKSS